MLAVALAAIVAVASGAAIPPAPTRWVEDHAGFLSTTTRDALDRRLESYERETGHQVVVWIGDTLDGAPLDDWAVRTFERWQVGRKGVDDGVVMFVLAADRAIDIEVGYGLEDRIPDAVASRVIREVMVPRLQAGEPDAAVTGGVDALLAAIEGRPWSASEAPPAAGPTTFDTIVNVLLAIGFLILLVTRPRTAWLLTTMRGGRGGRFGRGGGGGGFSGGGGRSGGGGARGTW